MSDRSLAFFHQWIADNVRATDDASRLATSCLAAATAAGISPSEFEEDMLDPEQFILEHLEFLNATAGEQQEVDY